MRTLNKLTAYVTGLLIVWAAIFVVGYFVRVILRASTFARFRETHVKTCPDCNGDGVIEKVTDDERQCPMCSGSGLPDDDENEEVIRSASWWGNPAKWI